MDKQRVLDRISCPGSHYADAVRPRAQVRVQHAPQYPGRGAAHRGRQPPPAPPAAEDEGDTTDRVTVPPAPDGCRRRTRQLSQLEALRERTKLGPLGPRTTSCSWTQGRPAAAWQLPNQATGFRM